MRKSACMKQYAVACKFLQVATNTIEQLAMQQKSFGRAEILCKVPFVKCMQVAENGNKNAPSSLQNSNVALTGKTFGNTNKGGSVSKQGFVKREFYCRNKLILFVVEVFPLATNTARQRQFCAKTALVMYFLYIINAVLCSYLLRVLFCMSSRSRFSAVAEQYKNSIQKTKRSK